MIAVYFASDRIQAVEYVRRRGRLEIQKALSRPLEEGCILGGRILKKESVTEQLCSLANELSIKDKKICVGVDGAALTVKRLTLPNVSARQRNIFLRDSMPARESSVYDHIVLGDGENGGLDVLACRAEVSFVEDYIQVMKDAGLRIDSIGLGICGVIRLNDSCKMLRAEDYSLLIADRDSVSCISFREGKFYQHSRQRLFSGRNAEETASAAYKLLPAENNAALLCGFTEEESDRLKKYGVRCAHFPKQPEITMAEDNSLAEYLLPVSAAIQMWNKKHIDLYAEYLRSRRRNRRLSAPAIAAIVFSASVLISTVVGTVFLANKKADLIAQRDELDRAHSALSSDIEAHDCAVSENLHLENEYNDISVYRAHLNAETEFEALPADLFSQIKRVSGRVTLTSVSSNELVFILGFSAPSAEEVSAFIERLRGAEIFSDILYSGYNKDGSGFSFTLKCTLGGQEVDSND